MAHFSHPSSPSPRDKQLFVLRTQTTAQRLVPLVATVDVIERRPLIKHTPLVVEASGAYVITALLAIVRLVGIRAAVNSA